MTDWAGNKISAGDTIVWVSFRYTPMFNDLGFFFPYADKGKTKFIPVKNPDQPRYQWKVISENKVVSQYGELYYEEIQGDKRFYFQLEYPFEKPKHTCLCIKGVSNYKSLFFEHYFNN